MNTPVREGETIEGSPPVPCGIDPIQCSSAQYTREVSSREVLMRGPHLRSRGPQGPHKHMAVPLRYVSGGKSSPSVRCNRGRNTQASAEDPRSGTVAAADERNSSSNQRDAARRCVAPDSSCAGPPSHAALARASPLSLACLRPADAPRPPQASSSSRPRRPFSES